MHPAEPLLKLALRDLDEYNPAKPPGLYPARGGYSAARLALASLFPLREVRLAKEAALIDDLKAVKKDSDARNWKAKHGRLRELIHKYPDDFYVDSRGPGNIVGVTHRSTGFRYHMPVHALPEQWFRGQQVREPEVVPDEPEVAATAGRGDLAVGAF